MYYQTKLTHEKRADTCVFSTLENSFRGRFTACAQAHMLGASNSNSVFDCVAFNDEHAHLQSSNRILVVVLKCAFGLLFGTFYVLA